MYLVLIILIVLVCLFLGFIVLIQNPKGGGLSSNFSSSSQLMGVQKTGDFLEKGTWILAISLMVLSLAVNVAVKSGVTKTDNNTESHAQVQKNSRPTNSPAATPGFGTQGTTPGTATPPPATPAPAPKGK